MQMEVKMYMGTGYFSKARNVYKSTKRCYIQGKIGRQQQQHCKSQLFTHFYLLFKTRVTNKNAAFLLMNT